MTFECPTDEDMKKFPLDMQIKLCGVMTKVDEEKVLGERALKGIQLQFTNDVHTPVYQTKWGEDLPPRVTVVSQDKRINQIGILLGSNKTIRGLRLIAEDGEFLLDQVWLDDLNSEWVMQPIPAGHEIIGLYGSLTSGPKNAYI